MAYEKINENSELLYNEYVSLELKTKQASGDPEKAEERKRYFWQQQRIISNLQSYVETVLKMSKFKTQYRYGKNLLDSLNQIMIGKEEPEFVGREKRIQDALNFIKNQP